MKTFGLTRPVLRFGPSVFPAGWAFYFVVSKQTWEGSGGILRHDAAAQYPFWQMLSGQARRDLQGCRLRWKWGAVRSLSPHRPGRLRRTRAFPELARLP